MIKNLLGLKPMLEADGSFSPSKTALRIGVSQKTDFEPISHKKYQGKRTKILVLFTENQNLLMKNGTYFSTGNHPVEAFLPMLHLKNAGFDFEIATPTGKPAVFEMWAFPQEDEHVKGIYNEYKAQLEQPVSLADFIKSSLSKSDSYAALFIPGGHGAMIGIPEDKYVNTILRWADHEGLYTISLCHGPGAFLATNLDNRSFLYSGYNMAVFPDSVDNKTPLFGYLPGKMVVGVSEELKSLGVKLMNSKMDKTVCVDRRLITGSSPLASNELGKLSVKTLLEGLS